MGGAALGVVGARLVEAELAVDRQPHIAGVVVLLAVVFPPANGAKGIGGRRLQSFISTAWTAITMFHDILYGSRRPT